jgi:hypothetical protein
MIQPTLQLGASSPNEKAAFVFFREICTCDFFLETTHSIENDIRFITERVKHHVAQHKYHLLDDVLEYSCAATQGKAGDNRMFPNRAQMEFYLWIIDSTAINLRN